MRRPKLKAVHRQILRDMGDEALALRYDARRRFRNALLAIALDDPRWMMWVERNLPNGFAECVSGEWILLMVEARARAPMYSGYKSLIGSDISGFIFRHNRPFTDRGNLSPG